MPTATRSSAPAPAITVAPSNFAACTPVLPSPPPDPITSTHAPGFTPALPSSNWKAVGKWRMNTATSP